MINRKNCGKSIETFRIIGGSEASLGQFPWIALIGFMGNSYLAPYFYCGGSLINKRYVITAAHCIFITEYLNTSIVRLGEYNQLTVKDCTDTYCAPDVQDFYPKKFIVHNKYRDGTYNYDIALIRLDKRVIYNDMVFPICLPINGNKNSIGKYLKVAGWGVHNIERKNELTPILLKASVQLKPFKSCVESFMDLKLSKRRQICAGGEIGVDSCSGDSGGPLMGISKLRGTYRYFLNGIVSFGAEECGANVPAVYTNTSYYIEWILNNIQK